MTTIVSILVNLVLATLVVLFAVKQRKEKTAKALRASKNEDKKQERISYFIHQLELAETLDDIFLLHIRLWGCGIRHENFGPDRFGMFRTDNILLMDKAEVYLGNIWGLATKPLTWWKNQDPSDRELVLKQYKNVLISNLKAMQK